MKLTWLQGILCFGQTGECLPANWCHNNTGLYVVSAPCIVLCRNGR